ncbi:MAG: transposase [Nanoarchaeota archaeon]|nr:transposase [Nanoarchaeota archaeon]
MPKPKQKTYWQLYDLLYKKHSKKSLFKLLKKKAKKLGTPYKKKDPRGRKPKFSPITYASFICVQKIFRHRYREMELESDLYLNDKADHSTFARNYSKIPEEYVENLIVSLVNKEFSFFIADSTAISSKIRVERTRQGIRKKELLTDKYHIVIGYDPGGQSTMILGVKATDNHVSDSKGAVKIMKGKKENGYFFGDSAYNTYELHNILNEVGLSAVIKPDKRRVRKTLSVKARKVKLFFERLYKEIRGIVETVFGGATNAGLILSYAKNEHTRRLDTLMLALRHNLMASIRVIMFLCDKLGGRWWVIFE